MVLSDSSSSSLALLLVFLVLRLGRCHDLGGATAAAGTTPGVGVLTFPVNAEEIAVTAEANIDMSI